MVAARPWGPTASSAVDSYRPSVVRDVNVSGDVSISSTTTSGSLDSRQRIRQRIPKSCLPCLSGKRACDRTKPICSRCARTQHECKYADEPLPVPRMARPKQRASSAKEGEGEEEGLEGQIEKGDGQQEEQEEEEGMDEQSSVNIQDEIDENVSFAKKRRKTIHSIPLSSTNASPTFASTLLRTERSFDDTNADSDVHRAGQALVNLQANTPWSSGSGRDIPSPSVRYSAAVLGPSTSASGATTTAGMSANVNSPRSHATVASSGGRMRESVGVSDDAGSHVNVNGQPLWHGDTLVGSSVFNQVSSSTDHTPGNQDISESTADIPTTNIQNAFNGLLYPMTDSFPFETIWPSGANFKQEVLPLLPTPKQGKGVLDAFKRFVRTASPGLLDTSILVPATDFLCNRSEKNREMISLPWLASFLMIVAVGQESQRACGPTISDDEGEEDEDDYRYDMDVDMSGKYQNMGRASVKSSPTRKTPQDVRKHCDLLLSATYQSLRLCSFLGSPNLQTIYAQLLIGVFLLHTERASNAWPILGSITRQAQSIGLHVEPSYMRDRMSTEERELRRKIWWTIVQQDVLLSSIFGRPLAVSRFTCRVTSASNNALVRIERPTTYQEALCEFSILARKHLNEDQDQEWTEEQLEQFKKELLMWYYGLPPNLVINLGKEDSGSKQSFRQQLMHRGSVMIQHSVDLCLQVQFTLLSLYRNRLVSGQVKADGDADYTGRRPSREHSNSPRLNEGSLQECARCVQNITMALSSLIDLLGTLQAGMLWVRVFYAFHAGVTAAYLALSRATSPLGSQARDHLTTLTDVCQRLPDRFDGLKTVKATFGVLGKLVQVHAEQQRRKAAGAVSTPDFEFDHSRGIGTASSGTTTNESGYRGGESGTTGHRRDSHADFRASSFSTSQLDELLTTNNIGIPAFNIARETTFTGGVAPIFDSPYGKLDESGHSVGGGFDPSHLTSSSSSIDPSNATPATGHGHGPPLYAGGVQMNASGTLDGIPPSSGSLSTQQQPLHQHQHQQQQHQQQQHGLPSQQSHQLPGSRPDRGFPEPFGPMIAPPGPDASTNEIVSFWREFFALPFEASDLG